MTSDNHDLKEWESLFEQATPAEREEILFHMLMKIEKRENSIIELCKENPLHLEALPISKLKEMAVIASEDAHALILVTHPDTAEILTSLEGLVIFGLSTQEPTAAEIRDTIADISSVWTAAGSPVEDHDSRPHSMLISSKERKQERGEHDK